jgi:hypothetical protein
MILRIVHSTWGLQLTNYPEMIIALFVVNVLQIAIFNKCYAEFADPIINIIKVSNEIC